MRIQAALEVRCVALVVMLHSSLGKGINKAINCTYPELKHPIVDKESGSDEVLGCSKCRECGLGREPEIPCGTTLGRDDPHGSCNDCGEGMYSNTSDTNACKMCRYRLCFEHQLYEGNCTKEKDESHCLPKCEAGYVMNKEQTKCEVDQSDKKNQTNTVHWTNTSKTTLPTTTLPVDLNNQKDEKYELPVTVIVVIVIGTFVTVAAIVIFVCYRWRTSKRNPVPQEGGVEGNGLDSHNKNEPLQVVNCSKQEVGEVNVVIGFPSQETAESPSNESDTASNSSVDATTLLIRQRIPNNSSHNENEGYVHSTPPTSGPLIVERPGSLAQPATTVLTQQQLTEIVSHASGTNLWKFDKLPCEMYNKICRDFDKNIPGISSGDLAGWLELTVGEVSRIKNEKSKTHAIIEIWIAKDENHDVKNFIKILEDKKVARSLAGEILKCAEQVYK